MTKRMRWSKLVFILPLLLLGGRGVDAATTVTNFKLKGNTVTALFEGASAIDPCLMNFVSVTSSDLIERVKPDGRVTSLRTVMVVIQQDICADVVTFAGQGESTTPALQVAGDLSSAKLMTKVPVVDRFGQVFNFDVNLTWKATESPLFVHSKDTFEDPDLGIKITAKMRSTQAEATATGSVFGDGQEFTPEASDEATIQKQNDGTLVIQKTF